MALNPGLATTPTGNTGKTSPTTSEAARFAMPSKVTPSVRRCVTNAYLMPGQSWTTKLSDGGITSYAQGKGATLPTPAEVYGRALPVSSVAGAMNILVMDIFDWTEMPMEERPGVLTDHVMSHGNMVVAHMLSLLRAAGYGYDGSAASPRFPEPEISGWVRVRRGSSTVTITKIPLQRSQEGEYEGMYTDDQVMRAWRRADWSGQAVLNMSFAMVPCDVALDYQQRQEQAKPDRYTFNAFLRAYPQAWARMLEQPTGTWLLNNLLPSWVPRQLIAVAASGNYGQADMTWPAKAAAVIGVGVYRPRKPGETGWNRAVFSDVGDVYARGEWFTLPLRRDGAFNDLIEFCEQANVCVAQGLMDPAKQAWYADFGYRGTSFSAPSVAVYLALSGAAPCRTVTDTGWSKITPNTRKADAAALLNCP